MNDDMQNLKVEPFDGTVEAAKARVRSAEAALAKFDDPDKVHLKVEGDYSSEDDRDWVRTQYSETRRALAVRREQLRLVAGG